MPPPTTTRTPLSARATSRTWPRSSRTVEPREPETMSASFALGDLVAGRRVGDQQSQDDHEDEPDERATADDVEQVGHGTGLPAGRSRHSMNGLSGETWACGRAAASGSGAGWVRPAGQRDHDEIRPGHPVDRDRFPGCDVHVRGGREVVRGAGEREQDGPEVAGPDRYRDAALLGRPCPGRLNASGDLARPGTGRCP